MSPDAEIAAQLAGTGRLRAAINLSNPVLAQSRTVTPAPAGVTIDMANELARVLHAELELLSCDTAAHSLRELASNTADVGFMAIDPARATELSFTSAYMQLEGCYLVRDNSRLQSAEEVDRSEIQVVAGEGSAYELFLSRELRRARIVKVPKSEEVVVTLLAHPVYAVAAGVREQLEADAKQANGQVRILPGAFMAIRQGMAVSRRKPPRVIAFVDAFLHSLRTSGFIAASFRRHGFDKATLL